jgi:hypothetical protein
VGGATGSATCKCCSGQKLRGLSIPNRGANAVSTLTRSDGKWQGHETHGTAGAPSSLHGRPDDAGPGPSSAHTAGLSTTEDHPSASAARRLRRARTDLLVVAAASCVKLGCFALLQRQVSAQALRHPDCMAGFASLLPVYRGRMAAALTAGLLAWSAVADAPAACADAQCDDSGPCSPQTPGVPHSCSTCPCRLPLLAAKPGGAGIPTGETSPTEPPPDSEMPSNAELPAPPTPPPLSLR